MKQYDIRIEVNPSEIKAILDEITQAQEKIYQCYNRLIEIGVVTIVDKATRSN